eukprot:1145931-Prymnesium_polylepis.3
MEVSPTAAAVLGNAGGGPLWEEMVTVSVILIQRLWQDKLKERRKEEKRKKVAQLGRLSKCGLERISTRGLSGSGVELPAAVPDPVAAPEVDTEEAIRGITKIQSSIRSKAQRAKIK